MSADECNMIFTRSAFLKAHDRVGNSQIDYAAMKDGLTWKGEHPFSTTCRNIKLERRKHKTHIKQYLDQLQTDLQNDLGLKRNEAIVQTKHQLRKEINKTEGIMVKVKSMIQDLPAVAALESLTAKYDKTKGYINSKAQNEYV